MSVQKCAVVFCFHTVGIVVTSPRSCEAVGHLLADSSTVFGDDIAREALLESPLYCVGPATEEVH